MNNLILSFAKNDFKAKYAGSALGVIWAFIQPLVTILIYWFVFQVAFQNGPVGNVPYVLWLVSGIVPWFFFSESWGGATSALVDYVYLVKKVVFDVRILPIVRIISALFIHLFFVALVFIIQFIYYGYFSLIHIQVLYYILASLVLVAGLGRISSVLMVVFRDTSNIVGLFIQLGFWITPIFWDITVIETHYPLVATILKLNPVYYIVSGFRDTFVYNIWFWQKPYLGLYYWCVALFLFFISKVIFKKVRPHFADLI